MATAGAARLAGLLVLTAAVGCSVRAQDDVVTPASISAAEFEAIYRARTDSLRMRFTLADAQFMTGMIHHHAQAVEMARLVPERTSNPGLRTLAARIINAQRDEIEAMQHWLRERGQPVPELHESGEAVMVHGAGHGAMPGMLAPDQLRELRAARGPAFDRLFLTRMIEHHQGAVVMVHRLLESEGAAQDGLVFKFASDVQVDQTTEIARMQQMLLALPAGGDAR